MQIKYGEKNHHYFFIDIKVKSFVYIMIEKHPCLVSVVFTSSVIVFHHQVTNAVYGEWLLQQGCFEDRHTEIEGAAKEWCQAKAQIPLA